MFEVEQKFRISSPETFLASVSALNISWRKKVVEIDTYFQHPARNFIETDEALRVRRHLTFSGEQTPQCAETEWLVTYKGPRLDRVTKTRKELELPLFERTSLDAACFQEVSMEPELNFRTEQAFETAEPLWALLGTLPEAARGAQWMEMLNVLGFQAVRNVCKVRSKAYWEWEGAKVEFSYDLVKPLGIFAELEFLAETEADIPAERERLLKLADFLHLHEVEPRSYLALVIEAE